MTEITYTRQGDYNLPNLLPPQEEPVPHGKYALLRRRFLKEHRRITYTNLLTSGKLSSHLAEIQQSAQRRMEEIVFSQENQDFVALAAQVRDSGLTGEEAYLALLTGGAPPEQ